METKKEKQRRRRHNNVIWAIFGIVFLAIIFMWMFHKGPFEQNNLNLQQKKQQQDSLLFINQIQQNLDSGFVLIVKTSGDVIGEFGPDSRIEDIAGNKIKPFTYYYYVKGRLIQKRWSMNMPESEFIMTHNSQIVKMMIRRNTASLFERLDVKVFDVIVDPSQVVME